MSARRILDRCPAWCSIDHDADARSPLSSPHVHWSSRTFVQMTLEQDSEAVVDRKAVEVQLIATTPIEDSPGLLEPVHVYMHHPGEGRLLPIEARALARALLDAADLAESSS